MKRIPAVIALTAALSFGVSAHAQTSFADVPAGHWAQEAIKRAVDCGIILGYPDGTFRGKQAITRYEAAAMIGRLLDAVANGKCGIKAAGATGPGLDPAALEALQNAVQELSADLADQGVRISELEDNAVSQDDLSRVEELATEARDLAQAASDANGGAGVSAEDFAALQDQVASVSDLAQEARDLAEAAANTDTSGGTDPEALAALTDQVEAAGIAADTALAQSRDLQDSIDALNGRVDDLESQLGELGATVQGQADSIAALNDLVVLLNQDVLSLQDRVSALEGQTADATSQLDDINAQLDQKASTDDLEALREFTTLLRRDQTALADRVSDVEARVGAVEKKNAEQDARLGVLENNSFTISGSIGLKYYVSRTTFTAGNGAAPNFDVDILNLPNNPFSSGSDGRAGVLAYADFGNLAINDYVDTTGNRVDGNRTVISGGSGNYEGRIIPSFNINLKFNRNTVSEDSKGYNTFPITLQLDGYADGNFASNSGTDISPLGLNLTGLKGSFSPIGGAPLTFAFGVKPAFKFTNYAFNNTGGRGDGFVADATLPIFGLKLTGVYGSKNGDLFGTQATLVAGTGYTLSTSNNGFATVTLPTKTSGVNQLVVTFDSGAAVYLTLYDGTTAVSFAVPANSSTANITKVTLAPRTGTGAANGDNVYFRGVKGSASVIPGLEGGLYWAQEQKDIVITQGKDTSVLGGYVTGNAFGFLNLDGEYAIATVGGAAKSAIAGDDSVIYVKASTDLGILKLGVNYRAIGNDFQFINLSNSASPVFAYNQSGFGVDAGVALGFVSLGGYYNSRNAIDTSTNVGSDPNVATVKINGKNATGGALNSFVAASATNYGLGAGLRLLGFDIVGGYVGTVEQSNAAANTYFQGIFGAKLVHDGSKDGKLIAGLNLALGYAGVTGTETGKAASSATGIYAYGEYGLNVGGFKLTPKAYYGSLSGTGSVVGYGASLETPGFLLGGALTGAVYSDTFTPTTGAISSTFAARAGVKFDSFLLPNSTLSVQYGMRNDVNRNATGFGLGWADVSGIAPNAGSFNPSFAYFNGYGANTAGLGINEQGIYFAFGYYGLTFNYGYFLLTPETPAATAKTEIGQAFSITYKVKF